jgi:hypothetical protein
MFYGDALALTISPPKIELLANPGQKVEDEIKLFNETDSELTIYTSTANFIAKEGEEGVPKFLTPEEKEGDLADWIEIEEGPITILPLEQKVIPITINIPTWADPGGHYAGIFFGTQSPGEKEGTVVGVTGKLGGLILLRVSGDIEEEGKLVSFDLKDSKTFYEHLPIDFVIVFENLGNVHLKPQGEILIKNLLGRTSDIVDINKPEIGTGKNVLPESVRRFESSWIKSSFEIFPQGFLEKLKFEKDNFAFGRYKGDLILEYGTQGKKATDSVVFWVFPWHLILVTILGTGLLVCLMIVGIRRYNRWIIKKAMKE